MTIPPLLIHWLEALPWMALAGVLAWLLSLPLRNVTLVDTLWSMLFVIAGFAYVLAVPDAGPRASLMLVLVSVWALRLAAYLGVRTFGHAEDRRYAAIRRRNEPGFALKSLYLVFGFQVLLAWVISLPLLGAAASGRDPLGWLDLLGFVLWLTGFAFEAVGDFQLARFKADPASAGRVMKRGLWRYTRHPNYFGNFCIWWGLYLIALAGGAWWSIVGPLLMSFLLLRVSGVSLLEKDIGERRPGYADYVRRTNAFFPGPPRA